MALRLLLEAFQARHAGAVNAHDWQSWLGSFPGDRGVLSARPHRFLELRQMILPK